MRFKLYLGVWDLEKVTIFLGRDRGTFEHNLCFAVI